MWMNLGMFFFFFSFRVEAKTIETNEMRADIEMNFQWKHNIWGGINKRKRFILWFK